MLVAPTYHIHMHLTIVLNPCPRGDWNRDTWHRGTIKIVGTDIAELDNVAPYSKGGHRETWQRGTRSIAFYCWVDVHHVKVNSVFLSCYTWWMLSAFRRYFAGYVTCRKNLVSTLKQVSRCPLLLLGATLSGLASSTLAIWCRNVRSRDFSAPVFTTLLAGNRDV